MPAVGIWGYVLNLANTGHVLGYLGTHIDTPSYEQPLHPSSFATTVDVVYGTLDVSVFSDHVIRWLWIGGIVAAAGGAAYAFARGRRWSALLVGAAIAIPFVSPLLMIHAGDGIASLARSWGFPVRGHGGNVGGVVRTAQGAVFGPVGATAFLGIPFVTLAAFVRRRADWRHLVLAAAVPLFYILLGHEIYNYFMTRFLLVPAALVAPLFALFLASRAVAAAFLAVAAASVVMVVIQDPLRPLENRHGFGPPWQLTQVQAAYLTDETGCRRSSCLVCQARAGARVRRCCARRRRAGLLPVRPAPPAQGRLPAGRDCGRRGVPALAVVRRDQHRPEQVERW